MSFSENKPLISVCIPAFNNAGVIRHTISSIIAQTYNNWELIVVDDCSTDETVAEVKAFNDARIRVVVNERNLGMIDNWNKVAMEARGEFCKMLGGDDLLAPDCLEKQVAIFLSGNYPTVSLVTCYKKIIDVNGKVLMIRKYPFKGGLVTARKAISRNFLVGTNLIGEPVAGLFRTAAFSQIGLYDDANRYLVDLDFWLRVLLTGDLYVIQEPLTSFRISGGAVSSKVKSQQARLFIQFAKKIRQDSRFKITILHYWIASFMAVIIAMLRRAFMYFYSR